MELPPQFRRQPSCPPKEVSAKKREAPEVTPEVTPKDKKPEVTVHRVEAYYQAYPHVQIGVTGLIGRQIVTAQSPTEERWLKRWQFDTIFSF